MTTESEIKKIKGDLFVWVQGVSFYVKTTKRDILELCHHVSGRLTVEQHEEGTYFSVED